MRGPRKAHRRRIWRAGLTSIPLFAVLITAVVGRGAAALPAADAEPAAAEAALPEQAPAPPDLLVVQKATSSTQVGAYRTTIGWTVSWSCASIESSCNDLTLSDTLPAGLTVKEATGTGGLIKKVTVTGNTVTWQLEAPGTPGRVDAGSVGTLSITASAVCSETADQVFDNVVVLKASNAAQAATEPAPIIVKAAPSCAPPPPPAASKSAPARLNAGAAMPFTLRLPYAPSAYTLVDPSPPGLLFQSVTIEQPGTVTVSCNGGTTYLAVDFSRSGPFGACVKTNGFWNVTHTKFAIPAVADPGWGDRTNLKAVLTTRVPDNAPVGATFGNITLTGGPVTSPLTATGTVVEPGPAPRLDKTREVSPGIPPPLGFGGPDQHVSDSDLGYVIAFGNNGNSETATMPLIDPTVVDLLDPNVEFVDAENWWRIGSIKNEANLIGTGCRTPTFEKIPDWSGTGRTMLRWRFVGCTFPPANRGSNPVIRLHLVVRTKAGLLPGTTVFNRADLLSGGGTTQPMICDFGTSVDSEDLDGDGDTTESTCSINSADTWVMPKLATVDATKWVNGPGDAPGQFSRFPDIGRTLASAGGVATYRLFIDMRGNITAGRIQLIDILPHVGDTATMSNVVPRRSAWAMVLDGPIEVAYIPRSAADPGRSPQAQDEALWAPLTSGVSFSYSSATNPCRLTSPLLGQLHIHGAAYPKGCVANPWDLADPTGARSFAMDAAVSLDPFAPTNGHGDMLRLTVRVRNLDPVTPEMVGQVAWNSFAYTVSDVDGYEFLSAEPIKVGVQMLAAPPPPPPPPVPIAVGDLVWWDHDHDGLQDPGEPPIPGVAVTLLTADGAPASDVGGAPVPPAVTDAAGHYVFDNLARGSYRIRFAPPAGAEATSQAVGADRLSDSNIDATGSTPVFALDGRTPETRMPSPGDGVILADAIDPSIDAGFWLPLALGDQVWIDRDRDGIRDDGELPAATMTVSLTRADGSEVTDAFGRPIASTTTNQVGRYLFDNLLAGDYRVRFIPTAGNALTVSRAGTDVAVDSNPDSDGLTPVFSLSPNSPTVRQGTPADGTAHLIDPTVDAGVVLPVPPPAELPETGTATAGWAILALLVLVAGTMLVRLGRPARPITD